MRRATFGSPEAYLDTFTYDYHGRVKSQNRVINGRTTITSTTVITYQFDAANRLVESVEVGGDTTATEWDNAGRLITTTLPNGVVSVNQYDAAGRLLELTHTASDDSLIARYEYLLDG